MRRPTILLCLALVSVAWVSALAAAPTGAAPRLAAVTYAAGSLICHQQSDRSFRRGDAQYPVCARCQGLYVGGVGGVLLWIVLAGVGGAPRPGARRFATVHVARFVLVTTAVPTLATVASAWLGWWDASNVLRAVLALPLGATIAAVITAVAAGDLR